MGVLVGLQALLYWRPFYGEIRGALPEGTKASMLLDCVAESRCADVL